MVPSASASCVWVRPFARLEGIYTSGDVLLNSLKAQILAGEISVDEAVATYSEDIRASVARRKQ